MMTATMAHEVVSREEWLRARIALLQEEKALTHQRDELSRKRRELPWVKLEKAYAFDTPQGRKTLAELFGDKSQLIVYHFMFGPEWPEGCPGCSFMSDQWNGYPLLHLAQKDVAFTAVSRAPLARIEEFRKRMGWSFPWASSFESDFNRDFRVSFTKEELASGEIPYNYGGANFAADEMPGISVFAKDGEGQVYHTYSSYARGTDHMLNTYNFLDLTPKGRDESEMKPHPMAWVRHHDKYESAQPKAASCCAAKEPR